jgi:hypothetical protein
MAKKTTTKTSKPAAKKAQPKQPASPFESLTVAQRTASPAADNLAFGWNPQGDGSAELLVVYEGPLAAREQVLARTGTWRQGGAPWDDVQDVLLTRAAPGRFVGKIAVAAASTVEAVELAFCAGDEWDNGGRAPLGYYEWSPRAGRVEVR